MTATRIDVQITDNLDVSLLKTLNHEKCKLEALMHQVYSTKLNEIFSTDDGKLTSEKINAQKQQVDYELQAQLSFINHCNRLISDLEVRLKKHKSKPNFFQSPITKDCLIKDMNLMIETIKLTNQLIAKPQEANQLMPLFAKHSTEIEAHLKNEKMLTKSRNIWGGIIYALGGIILLVAPFFPMIFAGVCMGVVLAGVALGFASLGVGASLFSHAPAKAQSDLCYYAQRLNGMRV